MIITNSLKNNSVTNNPALPPSGPPSTLGVRVQNVSNTATSPSLSSGTGKVIASEITLKMQKMIAIYDPLPDKYLFSPAAMKNLEVLTKNKVITLDSDSHHLSKAYTLTRDTYIYIYEANVSPEK